MFAYTIAYHLHHVTASRAAVSYVVAIVMVSDARLQLQRCLLHIVAVNLRELVLR